MFSLLAVVLAVLGPVQSARELRDTSSSSSDSGSSSLPSAWTTGIATNYGGPSEGKDPASPSFGTEEVSDCLPGFQTAAPVPSELPLSAVQAATVLLANWCPLTACYTFDC